MTRPSLLVVAATVVAILTLATLARRSLNDISTPEEHVALLARQSRLSRGTLKHTTELVELMRPSALTQPKQRSYRLALATIARTGNGWMRGMLESAIGVATESVFSEPGATLSNAGDTYVKPCGWLGQCKHVHPAKATEARVIKTHFPFTTPRDDALRLLQQSKADIDDLDYLLLAVRNPLDNYEAWVRYVQTNVDNWESQPYLEMHTFVKAWALHHNFWFGQAQPRFLYRYEDLVQNPIQITKALLQACGLWQMYSLDDYAMLQVANISQLQSYRRKQLRSQTRQKNAVSHSYLSHSVADIQWVLDQFQPELARYGYDQLYTTWLTAKLNDWPVEVTERTIETIMTNTSSLSFTLSSRVAFSEP